MNLKISYYIINKMAKYIAFDTETTGVDSLKCNLLTVSFIVLDSELNKLDTLNISLKHENYYINPTALEVNKIDIIKHHNNSLDIIDARVKLITFLNKYKIQYNFVPIGHNILFDINFIKSSGLLTNEIYNKYISCNFIDTLTIAQFLKFSGKLPEKQSVSLINLCKYTEIKDDKNTELEHSAEYDTNMTIKLLKKFKSIINEPEEQEIKKKRKLI